MKGILSLPKSRNHRVCRPGGNCHIISLACYQISLFHQNIGVFVQNVLTYKLIILNPQKRSNPAVLTSLQSCFVVVVFFLWIICQSKKIGWARDLRLSSLDQRWNAEICLPKLPCDYTIYIIYTYIIIIHKCEISWISFLPHVM